MAHRACFEATHCSADICDTYPLGNFQTPVPSNTIEMLRLDLIYVLHRVVKVAVQCAKLFLLGRLSLPLLSDGSFPFGNIGAILAIQVVGFQP